MKKRRTLGEGKYLRLVSEHGWEFVERRNVTGIVVIVALTRGGKIALIEQFRPAVNATVLELPAGLAGDVDKQEAFAEAARRELFEETGYEAKEFVRLGEGAPSAGQSNEIVTFFGARNIRKTGAGGGDSSEDIKTHTIALDRVPAFVAEREQSGAVIDAKLWSGLYFAVKSSEW